MGLGSWLSKFSRKVHPEMENKPGLRHNTGGRNNPGPGNKSGMENNSGGGNNPGLGNNSGAGNNPPGNSKVFVKAPQGAFGVWID